MPDYFNNYTYISGSQNQALRQQANQLKDYKNPEIKDSNGGYKTISSIEAMMRMQGIYFNMEDDKYQRFKRFPINDLSSNDLIRNTKEYVFITKPELNIYSDTQGTSLNEDFAIQPMFADINSRYPQILKQLQLNLNEHQSPFINLLSYTVQNTIDISDTNNKEVYTAANIHGTKISYRGNSIESDQDQSFTLEFRETNRAEIYTLFRLWDLYSSLKALGIISPPTKNYAQKRILHDKVSAYKIIVDDTSKLIFWAKWYGVYPDGSPRSSWSETNDSITHNVQFKADFVEDMDPQILVDFNDIVSPYKGKSGYTRASRMYENGRQNNEVQILPFIEQNGRDFYLRWLGGSL